MSTGAEQLKTDLIDRVVERVRSRLDPDRAGTAERFVREFYAHVPPDDLLGDDADNLYGQAVAMLNFARVRKHGCAKVRVYNPQIEEHGYGTSHTVVEIVNDDMPFLVDSVTQCLADLDAQVHLVIHPILAVNRDGAGQLVDLQAAGASADRLAEQAAAADGTASVKARGKANRQDAAKSKGKGGGRAAGGNGGGTATKTRPKSKSGGGE